MCPMNPRLLRPTEGGFRSPDADARAYLAAVRIADGANLEPAVAKAISDFVIGCKQDGIFNAIKASCILAGARTLAGALTPLVGSAPTNVNNNFVSANYDRKNGLVGDGSTKSLNTNRTNQADGQNNQHMAVYVSAVATTLPNEFHGYIGVGTGTGATHIYREQNNGVLATRNRNSLVEGSAANSGSATGLIGMSRSASGSYVVRLNGSNTTVTRASQNPLTGSVTVLSLGEAFYSNGRISFYSLGESLDLALLDTRVSALISAIGAAI